MSTRQAQILLAAVISARATACMFSKILLEDMGPFTLMALRFSIAFVLLALIFSRKLLQLDARTIKQGLAIGGLFFGMMAFETMALVYTASSTVCFLENIAIVLVPLCEAAVARRSPNVRSVVCAAVALGGIGLLTLQDAGIVLGTGEILSLIAALFYTCAIMVTARVARESDSLSLGIIQVGVMGVASPLAAFAWETPVLPTGGIEWLYLAILVLVCTGFGFTLQPVAQRYLSSEQAGLFCALNPLVAGICGTLFLAEPLGPARVLGMICILAGILIASSNKISNTVKVQ